MTVGGSGFYTLMRDDKRLAYLQTHREDGLKATFYELWNEQLWEEFMGNSEPLEALQRSLNVGILSLRKIIKSPIGRVIERQYDLQGAVIRTHEDNDTAITVAGRQMPKVIWFDSPSAIEVNGRKELPVVPAPVFAVVANSQGRGRRLIDELGLPSDTKILSTLSGVAMGRGMRLRGLLVDEDVLLTEDQYLALWPTLTRDNGQMYRIERIEQPWLSSKDTGSAGSAAAR